MYQIKNFSSRANKLAGFQEHAKRELMMLKQNFFKVT